jgi:hypothetical protein
MDSPKTVLDTKHGKVRVTFVRSTWIYAEAGDESGQAHINDDKPALIYRNEEYIGSVSFSVTDSRLGDAERVSLSRRANWTDAPRTYAAAMVAAVREAVQTFIDEYPEVLVEADRADINNDLLRALESEHKAREALDAASAEVERLRKRLASL